MLDVILMAEEKRDLIEEGEKVFFCVIACGRLWGH